MSLRQRCCLVQLAVVLALSMLLLTPQTFKTNLQITDSGMWASLIGGPPTTTDGGGGSGSSSTQAASREGRNVLLDRLLALSAPPTTTAPPPTAPPKKKDDTKKNTGKNEKTPEKNTKSSKSARRLPHQPNDLDDPFDVLATPAPGSIIDVLRKDYRTAPPPQLLDADGHIAACLLGTVLTYNCRMMEESLAQCVTRYGIELMERALPLRCVRGKAWKALVADIQKNSSTSSSGTGSSSLSLPLDARGQILFNSLFTASTCELSHRVLVNTTAHRFSEPAIAPAPLSSGTSSSSPAIGEGAIRYKAPYIPPSERNASDFGPGRRCGDGSLMYPMTFGATLRNFQPKLLPKVFDFMPVHPDYRMSGGYAVDENDEVLFAAMAALSYMCVSHARGGWDCSRHYELAAAGCLLHFAEIFVMPTYVMSNFPREVHKAAVQLPGVEHIGYILGNPSDEHFSRFSGDFSSYFQVAHRYNANRVSIKGLGTIDRTKFDEKQYWDLLNRQTIHARQHMTTSNNAAYLYKTMGITTASQEPNRRVLLVSRGAYDYMHLSVELGFDQLGIEVMVTNVRDAKHRRCISFNDPVELKPSQHGNDKPPNNNINAAEGPVSEHTIGHYRSKVGTSGVYGRGYSYCFRGTDNWRQQAVFDDTVMNAVKNFEFDAVIYTFLCDLNNCPRLREIVDFNRQMKEQKNASPSSSSSTDDGSGLAQRRAGMNHRIPLGIIDHNDGHGDSWNLPAGTRTEAAFFSRELRRPHC